MDFMANSPHHEKVFKFNVYKSELSDLDFNTGICKLDANNEMKDLSTATDVRAQDEDNIK